MKKTIITSAFLLSLAAAQMASATSVSYSSAGSALNGANYMNFDNKNSDFVGGGLSGVSITFVTDAQYYDGNLGLQSGISAPPFAVLPNNAVHFLTPSVSPDNSFYISSGSYGTKPGAKVSMTFAPNNNYNYFGLLWGSVDSYNTIEFYSGANLVYFLKGSSLTPNSGFQGAGGSAYVNITDLPSFDQVVVKSSQYAFEFDNVAYGNVPDGGTTMIMLGGVLCGIGAIRRRLSV